MSLSAKLQKAETDRAEAAANRERTVHAATARTQITTATPCVGCLGRHDTEEDVAALEPIDSADRSLSDVLAALGYTHEPGEFGRRTILRGGWPVFHGIADSVWYWLRETGQIL